MRREVVVWYGGVLSCAVPVALGCVVLLCYCVSNSCVVARSVVLCCVVSCAFLCDLRVVSFIVWCDVVL